MKTWRYLIIFAGITAACLLAFGVVSLRRSLAPAVPKPNVVLVVLDALRADRVFAERNRTPLMPWLARFTQQAVRFNHAVTPCTWTRPAMASILTSLHVDTHQVYFSSDPRDKDHVLSDALPKSFETMAAYLKKAGYHTVAVQTNGNLTNELGFAEGFDSYEFDHDAPAKAVTDRALARLDRLEAPFFLYVHYLDPHLPYTPPDSYRKLLGFPPPLDPKELEVVTHFMDYFWDYVDFLTGAKPKPDMPPLSPEAQEAVRTLYDGEARYLDDELGRFLDRLRARYPDSILVILADHGEHFWEHGYLGHGMTMYEEELHVPLVISAPGLAPRVVDETVDTVDVLPTIAALLGLAPNPGWQGSSLFANRPDGAMTPAFSYTRAPWPACNVDREMVIVGNQKLIADRRNRKLELYDLAADPKERKDLAADRPKAVETLRALLDKHREENIEARKNSKRRQVQLDEATRGRLRELGY